MATTFEVRFGTEVGDYEPDIVKVSFSLIICILGLFGNLVAIFVILVLKEYQKSVTHWYVLQLAIADSLFLLTLPFKVSEDLNDEWIYPEWMCKAKETVLFLNYYASILFLVVMSVDRYIAVCHTFSDFLQRLRRRTTAFVVALVVWSVALLLCIPVMLYSFKIGLSPTCKCSYEFPDVKNTTARCIAEGFYGDKLSECLDIANLDLKTEFKYCRIVDYDVISLLYDYTEPDGTLETNNTMSTTQSAEWSGNGSDYSASGSGDFGSSIHSSCHYWDKPIGWFAFLSFNFAGMFLLPLIIMVVCYGLIVSRLSATRMTATNTPSSASFSHTTMGSSASQKFRKKSASRSDKDRRRVTIMCAALVGSFVACWLPFHAIHLAKIHGIRNADGDLCVKLPIAGSLLAYLNSALNPYLYSLLGTNFSRRWKLLKKSRGVRHFVSLAAWRRSDSAGGIGQGNSRKSRKPNGSQHSRQYSSNGPADPTMSTKASIMTKQNNSPVRPRAPSGGRSGGVQAHRQVSGLYDSPRRKQEEKEAPVTQQLL